MIKIRLRRVGSKKKPQYRLVIADVRSPRDGKFIDLIGHYNPLTDPETVVIAEDKARYWLERGAQPTDTAARLLAKVGIMEESKVMRGKIEAGITKPKASKKKAKADVEEKSETKVEEPKASIAEEPETSKEEPEASMAEEPETSKEEPEASIAEEPETSKDESEAEIVEEPEK